MPFNESYFWLLVTDQRHATPLESLPLSVNTELTLAVNNDKNDTYELWDVYNPSHRHGGKLNVTRMGTWEPVNGLTNELTLYKYKRRGDLQGMYLNFSYAVGSFLKIFSIVTAKQAHNSSARLNDFL